MRRTPAEYGLAGIPGLLDKAVTNAEYGHEFGKIAKHSREMHDPLLTVMQEFPRYTTEHLRIYRRAIEDALRMLEQLRGELHTRH